MLAILCVYMLYKLSTNTRFQNVVGQAFIILNQCKNTTQRFTKSMTVETEAICIWSERYTLEENMHMTLKSSINSST